MKIVEKNNFSNVITIIKGDIESIVLPLNENEKVDIIVSEWMGYGLYYENMLSSVLKAKKYLSSDGIMLPNVSTLFIQGMTTSDDTMDRLLWWKSINGFDLSEMNDLLTSEAQVEDINHQNIFTNRMDFHILNINDASDEDLDFSRPFALVSKNSGFIAIFNLVILIY
jgi:hypothetical protein